ncbi:hypothetical protein CY0110_16562 [Crocosphaera chwakensis CCY0110]|uniref:Uncharacterized protein n=1 Tax=Crocosphaera chwakensis CCY0110 TaxID=391612 RepID=A3IHZ4_9CHRO|nr:hypothetical protein CY0110_16562 [Crocosphaera chwakensis CCY0110]
MINSFIEGSITGSLAVDPLY